MQQEVSNAILQIDNGEVSPLIFKLTHFFFYLTINKLRIYTRILLNKVTASNCILLHTDNN